MPETFNNYNFSSVTYTVIENGNIAAEIGVATLTIMPNSGYTVTAADFSLDPGFSNQYVSAVTFAQSGLNVICSIVFLPGATMPSDNVTIPLCIIGEAEPALKTIQGTYTSTISPNITPVSQSNVNYSNSGTLGQNELLFTKTYTAASGHYLVNPSLNVTNGIMSNYNIVETPTYNSSGDLTSIKFDVYYTYPQVNASGDTISIVVASKALFVPVLEITSYSMLETNILPAGELRPITFFGTAGAVFSVVVSSTPGGSYTLISNQTLGPSGLFTANIIFPPTTADVVYSITISGNIANPFVQPNPIVLNQYVGVPVITLTASSSNGITGFVNATQSGNAFSQPTGVTLNSTSTLAVPNSNTLTYGGVIDLSNILYTGFIGANPAVAANVTNSSTVTLVDATGVLAGDRITSSNIGLAPFQHAITNVSGNVLTVTPNITATAGSGLGIWRQNGNVISDAQLSVTQTNAYTVQATFNATVNNFGDSDVTFTLDLDSIFDVVSSSQVFGPFGFGYNANSGPSACCSMTSVARYLDSNSLSTATKMYTDAQGNTLAPAGYYSFNGDYRYFNGTIFTSALMAVCPSCFTTLTLCYSSTSAANLCCSNSTTVTVYVAAGQTFENNTGMYSNSSLTSAAPNGFYSNNTCNTQTP
jgi:hypothetical protein